MTRINYLYEEERTPETYKAEEWITDEYGLTKKKNKLARVSGKFRRKTIDRKDYIFKRFETLLTK
jgi:colicin import membrane protein